MKENLEARRRSIESRNEIAKRQRDLKAFLDDKEKIAEHQSYELKWAEEKDAEDYQRELSVLKRDIFALRNKKGKIQKDVMHELLVLAKEKEKETESIVLKWAGDNDVKKYLEEESRKRRESIAFRNKEAKRRRDIDAEMHQQSIKDHAQHQELQAACQKDVETYVEECKRRKRLSLAARAKQHRLHIEWDTLHLEGQRAQRHKDTKDNALDRKFAELSREKERARRALDALRHPKWTAIGNPFASLLD